MMKFKIQSWRKSFDIDKNSKKIIKFIFYKFNSMTIDAKFKIFFDISN